MLLGDLGRRGDQGRAARGRCRPGAGGRPGSAATVPVRAWRAPAHGGLLPGGQPQQARPASRPQDRRRGGDPAAPARRWRCPGRELPGRRVRPAGLRRGTIAGAQPAPRPPRDLGLRHDGPRRGPARLRLRDPGSQRTDVDHRRPGCRRVASRPRSGSPSATSCRGCSARSGSWPRSSGGSGRTGRPPGRGQRVDVSLLGSTLAILVNQAQNAFVSGVAPGRLGNAHPNIVPYETFATADGAIAIAVGSERQWPRLCVALGLPELAERPALRHQRRPGRATSRAAPHPGRAVHRPNDGRLADAPSMRPRSRPGRSTMSRPPSHRRRPSRSG